MAQNGQMDGLELRREADADAARAAAEERALVAAAREGGTGAFAALVERYSRPVFSLCLASTLDRGEAEDLSQEVFVAAWRGLPRFRGDARFSTWLYTLTRHACVDRARRRRARGRLVELRAEPVDPSLPAREDGPGDVRAALAATARLSLPLRQALLLRDLQGLAYEEIAELQDVPLGTVRSRIAAARRAVAEALDE